ncbi:MAG: TIGR01777 family oxidoreductase [Chitinophagales bacterium]
MSVILITGGTGLIGTALTKVLLNKGYDVIILTRSAEKSSSTPRLSYAKWDIEKQTIDAGVITKADHIVHLAGAGVAAKRWTTKRKREIADSRTKSSALLVKALKENANNVKTIISSSAIGWYGPDANHSKSFIETDPAAEDFLGKICREWEASIDPVSFLGKRLVKLRTGIVFSNEGGALKEFKKPLRFGLATILGNGKQVVSWIHIEDLVHIYIYAIENNQLNGVYNAVAPYPVTNKNLVLQLAKCTRGKFFVPVYVPSFILKTVLGEMSIEVLKSAAVSCGKIKKEGYTFLYPSFQAVCKKML